MRYRHNALLYASSGCQLDNIIIQGQMFRMGPETMKALNKGKKEKGMDPHICQLNYENLGI